MWNTKWQKNIISKMKRQVIIVHKGYLMSKGKIWKDYKILNWQNGYNFPFA